MSYICNVGMYLEKDGGLYFYATDRQEAREYEPISVVFYPNDNIDDGVARFSQILMDAVYRGAVDLPSSSSFISYYTNLNEDEMPSELVLSEIYDMVDNESSGGYLADRISRVFR